MAIPSFLKSSDKTGQEICHDEPCFFKLSAATHRFAFGGEHVSAQQGLQAGWCEQMLDSCKWLVPMTVCAPPTHISIQANSKLSA